MEQVTQTAPQKTKPKVKPKKAASRAVSTIVNQPAAPAAPGNFLQIVATAAMDPRCDTSKMQALLDMQRQIEDRNEQKAWTRAFNAMQGELPAIDKDGKIDHGEGTTARGNQKLKTRFATFPALNDVCKPIMKRHGFTLSSLVEPGSDGRIDVVSILEHVEGKSRTSRFPMTLDTTGGKNNQQGAGSSMQYGMRYNMIALLQIVTKAPEDVDNDGFKQDRPINPDQLRELIDMADRAGADKPKFCALMDVGSMADIPVSRFEEAKAQLQRKLKAKQRKAAADFPGDR